jgi:hypothetical protein
MDGTASSVISDEAIDDIGPVTFAISHQHVVTNPKIVHCIIDFKSAGAARFRHDPENWEPVFGKDHAQT